MISCGASGCFGEGDEPLTRQKFAAKAVPNQISNVASPMLGKVMMQKHAITILKPVPHASLFLSHLREMVVKLKNVMEIPTGYQDETGFHFGDEPAEKDVKW
jgi:hypothetical protein